MQNEQLEITLLKLKDTQGQLVQSEKMAALGQLTAGIAHELNNPINYINSGLDGLQGATDVLMKVIAMYEEVAQDNAVEKLSKVEAYKKRIRFERLIELIRKTPDNIGIGAKRAAEIVKELRTFSRVNEDDIKLAHVHDGLESTLVLLRNQYKKDVRVVKKL